MRGGGVVAVVRPAAAASPRAVGLLDLLQHFVHQVLYRLTWRHAGQIQRHLRRSVSSGVVRACWCQVRISSCTCRRAGQAERSKAGAARTSLPVAALLSAPAASSLSPRSSRKCRVGMTLRRLAARVAHRRCGEGQGRMGKRVTHQDS